MISWPSGWAPVREKIRPKGWFKKQKRKKKIARKSRRINRLNNK